ncbi:MAG: transposase [Alphaproteobacteria bacterium]
MTDTEWEIVLEAFRAACSRRGGRGRDDRKFLEALHYFTVHNIAWRALPTQSGKRNSV